MVVAAFVVCLAYQLFAYEDLKTGVAPALLRMQRAWERAAQRVPASLQGGAYGSALALSMIIAIVLRSKAKAFIYFQF